MARKSTKTEGESKTWTALDLKALPLEMQKRIILVGKEINALKAELAEGFEPVTPDGKVWRWSHKGIKADGTGTTWGFVDAPKAKPTAKPEAAKVDVAKLFTKQGSKLVRKK